MTSLGRCRRHAMVFSPLASARTIFFLLPFLILCVHSKVFSRGSNHEVVPYNLGTSAAPIIKITAKPFRPKILDLLVYTRQNSIQLLRVGVFLIYTRSSIDSILDDSWESLRNPSKVFGKRIRGANARIVVKRRAQKDKVLRQLVGAGYTPRLVWLFGLMLRGIIHCTALPQIFNPPIGFGSGAVLAARFAHREWLPVIFLGWYGGDLYWKMFGVNGSPKDENFIGVPINIRKIGG